MLVCECILTPSRYVLQWPLHAEVDHRIYLGSSGGGLGLKYNQKNLVFMDYTVITSTTHGYRQNMAQAFRRLQCTYCVIAGPISYSAAKSK